MAFPVVTYPGVTGVVSADVTTSVGITPATITLVVSPLSDPLTTGTLVIGDGVNPPLAFPDCFCREPAAHVERGRNEKVLQIQDRRWRWRYGFPADGHWNQEAGSGKLVPWSVRSPWQLAYRLLTLMGELVDPADQIDLPGGLAHPSLPYGPLDRPVSPGGQYLGMGQNYGLTNANPETKWGTRPAAQCLADLADYWGRFVVLDPVSNRVRLVKVGTGADLPAGKRLRTGTVVSRDAIPAKVYTRGVADEIQMRFRLRAVGREWDRSWRPINELSYAPPVNPTTGQPMVVLVVGGGLFDNTKTYGVTINGTTFTATVGLASFAATAADLAAKINASAAVNVWVTASVSAGNLKVQANANGYEFELTTDGTSVVVPAPAWTWRASCVQGPIRGEYARQNVWTVTFPDPQPDNTVLLLTVNGVSYAQVVTGAGLNALADATDRLAAQVTNVSGASAVGGGRLVTVTGLNPGTAITVTAASVGGAVPTVTETATPLAPSRGWERSFGPPFGVFASLPTDPDGYGYGRLTYEQAKRLANETVHTCFQVVCENPADGTVKSIPVPEIGNVVNQFLLLLQPDSPEPVDPDPGRVEATDVRTLQPFAATQYNGYAVRRPNRAYGSVATHILAKDGLLWRGGSYLQHNTPPRSLLPLTFSVVDPEQQVVQFSQPVYRWLGVGAASVGGAVIATTYPTGFTVQPAEMVIECGVLCLDAATLSPRATSYGVAVPGGFGPDLVRVFPDIRREIIGTYDSRHNLTGFRTLDQDALQRGTSYAQGMADAFQSPAGEDTEFHGILSIPLDGKTRQVKWSVRKGEPGVSTSASVNCETSRVVPPYPGRRKNEGLPVDAVRAVQAVLSDFKAAAVRRNAAGAAAGGFGFQQGGR